MPQSNFTVSITFNKFPEIAQAMPGKTAQVVKTTAFNVEADAKNTVPVDTGALKNSIDTDIAGGGLSATVAPHTEYAQFVEFGTRRMSAQPYMTPAAERNREPFTMAMTQMLRHLA